MCDGPPHPRARKIPLSSCEAARPEAGRGGAEAEYREQERNLLKMTFRIRPCPIARRGPQVPLDNVPQNQPQSLLGQSPQHWATYLHLMSLQSGLIKRSPLGSSHRTEWLNRRCAKHPSLFFFLKAPVALQGPLVTSRGVWSPFSGQHHIASSLSFSFRNDCS